ncbi:hypothetical protein YC2023_023839 [Brassica napus]
MMGKGCQWNMKHFCVKRYGVRSYSNAAFLYFSTENMKPPCSFTQYLTDRIHKGGTIVVEAIAKCYSKAIANIISNRVRCQQQLRFSRKLCWRTHRSTRDETAYKQCCQWSGAKLGFITTGCKITHKSSMGGIELRFIRNYGCIITKLATYLLFLYPCQWWRQCFSIESKQMPEKGKKIEYKIKQSPEHKGSRSSTSAKTKKAGQRKNIHQKNKVTTKQKDACLKHQKHNHQLIDKKHLTN